MLPPPQEYHDNNPLTLLISFDLNDPAAVKRFYHERTGWQEDSDVEMLDADHAVLLVYAGGARRLLR